jgi:hypothetical protein
VRRRSPVPSLVCSAVAVVLLWPTPALADSIARAPSRPVEPGRAVVSPPVEADALSLALDSGAIDRATYALARARSLFHLADVRARYGAVHRPGPHDATLVLRDLVAEYGRLSPSQRSEADRILARPTDGASDPQGDGYTVPEATPYCSTNVCYHWVASTADAPDLTDANANSIPDYVETVATTLENVWTTEITTFGFRAPKSDLTSTNYGPDGRLDVYLAEIGDASLYGYCATDDPNAFDPNYAYYDASAYCVLDNDYSALEFTGPTTGVAALQVTAAHEFFHASQFAYDFFEDRWFMEATATWMEDEVYDDVNDNVQYLNASPLTKPGASMDSNNAAFLVYGDWIFFRFISEAFGSAGAHDVSVIRRAWKLADGSATGRDLYSLKAVAQASKAAGVPFATLFGDFAMVNDVAAAWYEEGADQSYPQPPLADRTRITKRNYVDAGSRRLRHLSSSYLEFVPGRGVASTAKLLLAVDLPPAGTGPAASAVVVSTTGAVRFFALALDRFGDGRIKVPFGRGAVAGVDLVLTNASTRTTCWVDSNATYSCWGDPADDGLQYRYGALLRQ